MINIIGKRFRFLALSGIIIAACIIALSVSGLSMGIDFSSGSILNLSFEQEVPLETLKQTLAEFGHEKAIVQVTGEGDFLIRLHALNGEEKSLLEEGLAERFGQYDELGFENVEPVIARQTANNAMIAMAVASVGVLLYITFAFRRMPKPLRYGTCAIIALIHDVIISVGVFAILGIPLNLEVNLMFITGVLAVIGYSVNDTVIIFDRIRENRLNNPATDFATVVNNSLVETLTRSLNTGLTTMVVILALLLFIGSTIENFSIVMLIGTVTGIYSSIFIATSLLVIWEKKEWKRFLPWLKPQAGLK